MNLDSIDTMWITSKGTIRANTHGCGCCSDTLSSDKDEYGYSEKINTKLVYGYPK